MTPTSDAAEPDRHSDRSARRAAVGFRDLDPRNRSQAGTTLSAGQTGDGTALLSEAGFAEWLGRRVAERTPAAVVRFGDGEERLMQADPAEPTTLEEARRKLRRETGVPISPQDTLAVSALVTRAFDEADVLGIRFHDRFLDEHKAWMNRLAARYHERVAAGRAPAALAHCLLSHDVLDVLPRLLAGRRVSVISCRDVRPVLEEAWGLADVAVYPVPSQHLVRDVDGIYEAAQHDVPIWPDAHARVQAALTVRERGEVFLVGAGLFGKDLCIRIRDLGGIALDMGSALDRLAGKPTRGPARRVLDLYADGMPVHAIATHLTDFYGVMADHATVVARIEEVVDRAFEDAAEWRPRPLRARYPLICWREVHVAAVDGRPSEHRACWLAIGISPDGLHEALGLWWQEAGDVGFWPSALGDLRRRGVEEVLVACAEAPPEFSRAVGSVFPRASSLPPRRESWPEALHDAFALIEPTEAIVAQVRRAVANRGNFCGQRAATELIAIVASRALGPTRRTRAWEAAQHALNGHGGRPDAHG